ncbi:hypothetical protein J6590_055236 [Homalodisca vitripennis]|nr:hypothetical protein J6590_055236 [Homalodisca vitripennis]
MRPREMKKKSELEFPCKADIMGYYTKMERVVTQRVRLMTTTRSAIINTQKYAALLKLQLYSTLGDAIAHAVGGRNVGAWSFPIDGPCSSAIKSFETNKLKCLELLWKMSRVARKTQLWRQPATKVNATNNHQICLSSNLVLISIVCNAFTRLLEKWNRPTWWSERLVRGERRINYCSRRLINYDCVARSSKLSVVNLCMLMFPNWTGVKSVRLASIDREIGRLTTDSSGRSRDRQTFTVHCHSRLHYRLFRGTSNISHRAGKRQQRRANIHARQNVRANLEVIHTQTDKPGPANLAYIRVHYVYVSLYLLRYLKQIRVRRLTYYFRGVAVRGRK